MSNVIWHGDCKATEDLRNLTLCIKEGNEIRNIHSVIDFHKENVVFVFNVPQINESSRMIIKEGKMVRYHKVYERMV